MIHGLMSSPLTWKELTNELLGDAYVRICVSFTESNQALF
jgi:hypothetical protein